MNFAILRVVNCACQLFIFDCTDDTNIVVKYAEIIIVAAMNNPIIDPEDPFADL